MSEADATRQSVYYALSHTAINQVQAADPFPFFAVKFFCANRFRRNRSQYAQPVTQV